MILIGGTTALTVIVDESKVVSAEAMPPKKEHINTRHKIIDITPLFTH
jgi:hypothetical protein